MYTGVTGRGTAASTIARACAGGIASAAARAGSSNTAVRVGNWPTMRARSSICSGRVRYSMTCQAASASGLKALIASWAPPNAAVGRPPGADGIGATAKRPATCERTLSCIGLTA